MTHKTEWEQEIRAWVAGLNLSPTRESEVVEELAQHVEDRYQEFLVDGLPQAEASAAALAEIRQTELIDELREIEKPVEQEPAVLGVVRRANLTGGLWADLRYAMRMLRKDRAVTLTAVLIMALGIGVNTAFFSTLGMLIFRPFSFANQEHLVTIWEQQNDAGIRRGSVAPGNFNDWQEQNSTLEILVAFKADPFDVSDGGQPERLIGNRVTPGFFETLGVKAVLGRTFVEEDYGPGKSEVVVIKHSLWQVRFGGDWSIIGRKIKINGRSSTVIGVMPNDFDFPVGGGELWMPLVFTPQARTDRASHELQVLGLPRPGLTTKKVWEDLEMIARRTQRAYPETNQGWDVRVVPLVQDATRGARVGAPFMFVSALLVLVIGCANVANLLLVRAASQQREIAIRLVLGASRLRMIRQFLADSVLLAVLGGALGLLFAVWSLKAIRGVPQDFSKFIPGWERMAIDPAALIFTFIVSIVTGLLCGLMPALAGTKVNLNQALKTSGRGGTGGAQRFRRILVISQVACSVVVLAGAAVMIRSFTRLTAADLGVNPTDVLTMQVALTDDKYDSPQSRVNFYQSLLTQLAASPDFTQVAAAESLPFAYSYRSRACSSIGDAAFPKNQRPYIRWRVATPAYFAAIGTPLRRGRAFTEEDRAGMPSVALVNEAFARQFAPNRAVIGQHIKCGDGQSLEIIGLAADVFNEDLDGRTEPEIYVPYAQEPLRTVYLVIRSPSNPSGLTATVRREVASLDQSAPVFNVKLMDQLINERLSPKRLAAYSLAVAGVIALIFAAVGLYALMAHSVNQRRYEIGLRLALGAQARDVLNLVIGAGMKLVLIGSVIGVVGAIGLTRSLAGLMFGVSVNDPLMYAAVALLLAIVALLACYLPARTALEVDPANALKHQ